MTNPPVCDYEGSDYQTSFGIKVDANTKTGPKPLPSNDSCRKVAASYWNLGGCGTKYAALCRFERVVLLDYSAHPTEQAQQRLAALTNTSMSRMTLSPSLLWMVIDAATMIRVLHQHGRCAEGIRAGEECVGTRRDIILEFANKQNFKSICVTGLGNQKWSPFKLEPVEFVKLNFDFHPKAVSNGWRDLVLQFKNSGTLPFRVRFLKRIIPTSILVSLDSLFQWTGAFWQFTPSCL